jgi:hypothetical protein
MPAHEKNLEDIIAKMHHSRQRNRHLGGKENHEDRRQDRTQPKPRKKVRIAATKAAREMTK